MRVKSIHYACLPIFSLLVFASSLFGQTPSASPMAQVMTPVVTAAPTPSVSVTEIPIVEASPSPLPTPHFQGQGDVSSLAVEMAESRFKLSPAYAAFVDLIAALGKYINSHCLSEIYPSLSSLQPSRDPICLNNIAFTLSLDPGNPEAICTRDGIDSPSCSNAYSQQDVSTGLTFPNSNETYQKFLIDAQLNDSKQGATLVKLQTEFSALSTNYQLNKNKDNRDKLYRAASELLDKSCAITRNIANPNYTRDRDAQEKSITGPDTRPGGGTTSPSTADALKDDMPLFSQMIAKLSNKTPSNPIQIPTVINRVRLISSQCQSTISSVLQGLPDFSRAICHRDGFYSPSCIRALRRQRSLDATTSGTPQASKANSTSGSGMQQF